MFEFGRHTYSSQRDQSTGHLGILQRTIAEHAKLPDHVAGMVDNRTADEALRPTAELGTALREPLSQVAVDDLHAIPIDRRAGRPGYIEFPRRCTLIVLPRRKRK